MNDLLTAVRSLCEPWFLTVFIAAASIIAATLISEQKTRRIEAARRRENTATPRHIETVRRERGEL